MTTVSLVEDIAMKVASLPVELQREVLDFVEFLAQRAVNGKAVDSVLENKDTGADATIIKSRRDFEGIWEDLGVEITAEEIAEARREMWGNFPRESFYNENQG